MKFCEHGNETKFHKRWGVSLISFSRILSHGVTVSSITGDRIAVSMAKMNCDGNNNNTFSTL
jgi:hypothetical protein